MFSLANIFRYTVHYMIYCLQISLRFNLRAGIFQKFPGGMPPDPLALACCAC